MKKLVNQSVTDYTKELARRSPTPGGGSSAALVAALGTALLEMSMEYSNLAPAAIAKIRKQRLRFLQLVDQDARVYAGVVRSRKKGLGQRKRALMNAVEVPRAICRNCRQALSWTNRSSDKIKPALRSDWVAGRVFLNAAMKSASLNIVQNLKEFKKIK